MLSLLFFMLTARADVLPSCTTATSKGSLCWVGTEELFPTQFTAGHFEVNLKTLQLADQIIIGNLERYLISHPMPAVIGPGNRVYITDGHHFTKSAHASNVPHVVVEIERNWSNLSEEEFWQKMLEHKWVYLYRLGEGPFDPSELPKSMGELINDPYRSLAYSTRKAGGYAKSKERYAEYAWADFLRTRVDLNEDNFGAAVVQAVEIARSLEAKGLPGWTCGKQLGKK